MFFEATNLVYVYIILTTNIFLKGHFSYLFKTFCNQLLKTIHVHFETISTMLWINVENT